MSIPASSVSPGRQPKPRLAQQISSRRRLIPGRKLPTACLSALFLPLITAAACEVRPQDRPPYLIDADGRIVIYHGINAANTAKHSPGFLPWQTKEDFARLRGWGFNLVRYLIFWEAVEPVQGQYDEDYLDRTIERIGWLQEQDIDVLLDVHQDLYGRRFTGNGFPDWTVNDEDLSFTQRQPWNLNYLEPAVLTAYKNFWRSDDLKARYIAMIEHVLSRTDGLPNVIGLDIMNEPFPGQDAGFEEGQLTRLYEDVQAMRRRNGFRTRLFFEPVISTSAGLPSHLRFQPDADGVYAPHYYDPLCHEGAAHTDLGAWWMRQAVEGKAAEARRFGAPMFIGEFGISRSSPGWERYLDDFLGLMNAYHLSWAYYSYDRSSQASFGILDENGLPDAKLAHLVMVYAQRIAGRNPVMTCGERSFELQYDPIACAAPTVVFVPGSLSGVRVTINGMAATNDPASLTVQHYNEGTEKRQAIRVEWN